MLVWGILFGGEDTKSSFNITEIALFSSINKTERAMYLICSL